MSETSGHQQRESVRAHPVFRPALAGTWGCGLLLAATFFMPLLSIGGCKGSPPTTVYPFQMLGDIHSPTEFCQVQSFTWSYLFALVAGCGTLLVALRRDAGLFRKLWIAYAVFVLLISLGLWQVMGQEVRGAGPDNSTATLLDQLPILIPTFLALGALVVTYFSCRTWLAAALGVQLTLAAIAVAWFMYLAIVLELDLLWGGKLSLAASVGLVLATLVEMRYALAALGIAAESSRHTPCAAAAGELIRWTDGEQPLTRTQPPASAG